MSVRSPPALLAFALLAPALAGCALPLPEHACVPAEPWMEWMEPGVYAALPAASGRPGVVSWETPARSGAPFAPEAPVPVEDATLQGVEWTPPGMRRDTFVSIAHHDGRLWARAHAPANVDDAALRTWALSFLANATGADDAARAAWADALVAGRHGSDAVRVDDLRASALYDSLAAAHGAPHVARGFGATLGWNTTGWSFLVALPQRHASVATDRLLLDLTALAGDHVEARAGRAWGANDTALAREDAAAAMRAVGIDAPALGDFRLHAYRC